MAIWGVINSVISVYYYLRPVVLMYMEDSDEEVPLMDQKPMTKVFVGASALFVLLVAFIFDPLYKYVLQAIDVNF